MESYSDNTTKIHDLHDLAKLLAKKHMEHADFFYAMKFIESESVGSKLLDLLLSRLIKEAHSAYQRYQYTCIDPIRKIPIFSAHSQMIALYKENYKEKSQSGYFDDVIPYSFYIDSIIKLIEKGANANTKVVVEHDYPNGDMRFYLSALQLVLDYRPDKASLLLNDGALPFTVHHQGPAIRYLYPFKNYNYEPFIAISLFTWLYRQKNISDDIIERLKIYKYDIVFFHHINQNNYLKFLDPRTPMGKLVWSQTGYTKSAFNDGMRREIVAWLKTKYDIRETTIRDELFKLGILIDKKTQKPMEIITPQTMHDSNILKPAKAKVKIEIITLDKDIKIGIPEISIKTQDEETLMNLADSYMEQEEKQAIKSGEKLKFTQTLFYLDQAIKSSNKKTRIHAYDSRARVYQKLHNFEAALNDYQKALELSSDDKKYVYYNQLGICNYDLNKLDEAITNFTLAINNDEYGIYSNRGLVYEKKKDIYNAIKDYMSELNLYPDNQVAVLNLKSLLHNPNINFSSTPKKTILNAILKIPEQRQIAIYELCTCNDNPLGNRFYKKEGIGSIFSSTDCNPKEGKLAFINERLIYLRIKYDITKTSPVIVNSNFTQQGSNKPSFFKEFQQGMSEFGQMINFRGQKSEKDMADNYQLNL